MGDRDDLRMGEFERNWGDGLLLRFYGEEDLYREVVTVLYLG